MPGVGFDHLPLHACDGLFPVEEPVFFIAPPIHGHGMVENPGLAPLAVFERARQPDKEADAHAHLNAKDVVRGAGELRVLPHVAAEIEHIDEIEILREMLAHAVARHPIDEAIVSDVADHAALADAIGRVANGFDVWVAETVAQRRFGVGAVGYFHPAVGLRVFAVLVVVVLVLLPRVVRRVGDDDLDALLLLPLDAGGVGLIEERAEFILLASLLHGVGGFAGDGIESIDQADAFKRLIAFDLLPILMLNVH